jgi:hypothetical protein
MPMMSCGSSALTSKKAPRKPMRSRLGRKGYARAGLQRHRQQPGPRDGLGRRPPGPLFPAAIFFWAGLINLSQGGAWGTEVSSS